MAWRTEVFDMTQWLSIAAPASANATARRGISRPLASASCRTNGSTGRFWSILAVARGRVRNCRAGVRGGAGPVVKRTEQRFPDISLLAGNAQRRGAKGCLGKIVRPLWKRTSRLIQFLNSSTITSAPVGMIGNGPNRRTNRCLELRVRRKRREYCAACSWLPGNPAACYRLRRSRINLEMSDNLGLQADGG